MTPTLFEEAGDAAAGPAAKGRPGFRGAYFPNFR